MPHTQARAPSQGGESGPAGIPGGWLAAMMAALAALLFGYWARQTDVLPRLDDAADIGRIAEVSPEDFEAALGTMAGTPRQVAQLRDREACGRRLAWVTIMRAPGQPPGRIRLQSGTYYSPPYELGETPVRIALPYPAPYETGRGVILVVGTTTPAFVALTPPWHVPAKAGVEAKSVKWTPVGACPKVAR